MMTTQRVMSTIIGISATDEEHHDADGDDSSDEEEEEHDSKEDKVQSVEELVCALCGPRLAGTVL